MAEISHHTITALHSLAALCLLGDMPSSLIVLSALDNGVSDSGPVRNEVIFLACALTCLTGPESVANAKHIPGCASNTEKDKGSSDSKKDKGSSDSKKDKSSSDSKKDKSSSDSKKDKGSSDSKKGKSSSDSEKDKGSSDSKKDKGSSDSKKDKGSSDPNKVKSSSDSNKDKGSSDSESGELDRCNTSPCKNNGTCVEGADNYTCSCTDGFRGRNCEELDRCSTGPCKNNGTCVEGADNYTCSCTDGFRGRNYEEEAEPCLQAYISIFTEAAEPGL
ncbi:delta-like protein C [Mercenaria mercenaria]|uniref:delta-like protein C n=1 Tax=Mercenaria mercenaria TaxID=6596 RepID=UPI00234F7B1C|nr:delta-like protein C [Mercenaria mercenaria]